MHLSHIALSYASPSEPMDGLTLGLTAAPTEGEAGVLSPLVRMMNYALRPPASTFEARTLHQALSPRPAFRMDPATAYTPQFSFEIASIRLCSASSRRARFDGGRFHQT